MKYRATKLQGNLFDILEHSRNVPRQRCGVERLNDVIDWESFRPLLEKQLRYRPQHKGGRRPWDPVLMLKVLVLQKFYGLSDENTEFNILDRFSFMRFLGLTAGDGAPDHSTIWSFKERLGAKGIEAVFKSFNQTLNDAGLIGNEGCIVDASFVDCPKQRNSREDNGRIKEGERPEHFNDNPNVGAQKDTDARWAKKGEEVHFGYKNHAKVNAVSKLIESSTVTDASVHDSRQLEALLVEQDSGRSLWADSAYTGVELADTLESLDIKALINQKGTRNRPLNDLQKAINRTLSSVRCRVEHVFGRLAQMKADKCRRIGIPRAEFEIILGNLTYNLDRYAILRP